MSNGIVERNVSRSGVVDRNGPATINFVLHDVVDVADLKDRMKQWTDQNPTWEGAEYRGYDYKCQPDSITYYVTVYYEVKMKPNTYRHSVTVSSSTENIVLPLGLCARLLPEDYIGYTAPDPDNNIDGGPVAPENRDRHLIGDTNKESEEPKGIDVIRPVVEVRWDCGFEGSDVTDEYVRDISGYVGMINAVEWRGYEQGTLLLTGIEGIDTYQTTDVQFDASVELSFTMLFRPRIKNMKIASGFPLYDNAGTLLSSNNYIIIGEFDDSDEDPANWIDETCDGHCALDAITELFRKDVTTGGGGNSVKSWRYRRIHQIDVWNVYEPLDFDLLKIPTEPF